MKRFLAFLLLLILPAFALADLVARRGNDSVRLRLTPCTAATVLPHLGRVVPGSKPEDFRSAGGIFGGHVFEACWHPIEGGAHLIYEDGDQGSVPVQDLHTDDGV